MKITDIITLLKEFDDSSASEFRYRLGDESVEFRKPVASAPVQAVTSPQVQPVHTQESAAATPSAPLGTESAPGAGTETINSPIVGSFYRSPAPDAPVFVEEGSVVEAGSTLGIIEAMKVMNELEAEFKLEVVAILVEDGAMVEHGTPIFEVKRL